MIAAFSFISSFLSFTGFNVSPAEAELIGWYDSRWHYRKEILVNREKVEKELTDFILFVDLVDRDLKDWSHNGHVGQTDGGDIMFVDASGKKLQHELETYDPSSGRLVAWIKLDELSPVSDRQIYLYYGNPKAEDQWSLESIFGKDLVLVQHMSSKQGVLLDSSPNSNRAKREGGGLEEVVSPAGMAQNFDGHNDYLNLGNDLSLNWNENGYISKEGEPLEGFESESGWLLSGRKASRYLDRESFKEGAASVKLSASGGESSFLTKKVEFDLSSLRNLTFWAYISDHTKLDSIGVQLASSKDWSKYSSASVNRYSLRSGWNRIILSRSDFKSKSGGSLANRAFGIRLSLKAAGSKGVSVNFDDLRYNQQSRAKAIITFDDGYDDVFNEAFPIMAANGQKGVAFVTSDYVDTIDHMTKANLLIMRDAGWDISNHTKSHQQLTKLSWEGLDREINGCYQWLVENGFEKSARYFAYPYGLYNDRAIQKVKEKHVLARSVIDDGSQAHLILGGNVEYLIKALNVTNKVSVSTVKKAIDEAILTGSPVIIFLHQIVDEEADKSTKYLTSDFKEISDYLKSRSKDIDVITFDDYYKMLDENRQFSIEVHLKPDRSSQYASVIEKYHPSYDRSPYRIASMGEGRFAARLSTHDASAICDFGLLPTDRYSHLVVTYDGAKVRTYRDGLLTGEAMLTGSLLRNQYPLYVGKRGNIYWKGSIDELRIYNRTLASDEISTRYNNQSMPGTFIKVLDEERL